MRSWIRCRIPMVHHYRIGGFVRRLYEKTPDDDAKKNYLRIMMEEVVVLENRVSEIIKVEDDKNELAMANEGQSTKLR